MKPNRYTIAPAPRPRPSPRPRSVRRAPPPRPEGGGRKKKGFPPFLPSSWSSQGASRRATASASRNVAPCRWLDPDHWRSASTSRARASRPPSSTSPRRGPGRNPDEEQRIELWEGAGFRWRAWWREEDGDQVLTLELRGLHARRCGSAIHSRRRQRGTAGCGARRRRIRARHGGGDSGAKMFNNRGFRQRRSRHSANWPTPGSRGRTACVGVKDERGMRA